jgi:VWFA-related protein
MAGFSESNMFDALTDTAERMSKVEGRKAILYIGTGIDTFSRMTYDKTRKSLQESGVPVYSVGTMQVARMMAQSSGMMGAISELDFLQADNELRTFAKETGGQAFFPRFIQEMPQVFASLTKSLRSNYSLAYISNNQAHDGKYRRISVQLVDPKTGEPVRMTDDKGKPFKYTIVATPGYDAPRAVE